MHHYLYSYKKINAHDEAWASARQHCYCFQVGIFPVIAKSFALTVLKFELNNQ